MVFRIVRRYELVCVRPPSWCALYSCISLHLISLHLFSSHLICYAAKKADGPWRLKIVGVEIADVDAFQSNRIEWNGIFPAYASWSFDTTDDDDDDRLPPTGCFHRDTNQRNERVCFMEILSFRLCANFCAPISSIARMYLFSSWHWFHCWIFSVKSIPIYRFYILKMEHKFF